MKYIREYNHQFYYQIGEDEWNTSETSIEFTDNDLEEIRICLYHINPSIRSKHYNSPCDHLSLFGNNWTINISPQSDEWFLIDKSNVITTELPIGTIGDTGGHELIFEYYKCDQLEGLLKFLNENIN